MKPSIILTSLLLLAAVGTIYVSWSRGKAVQSAPSAAPSVTIASNKNLFIAAPGRVEPAS
jgi:hypothetical protein